MLWKSPFMDIQMVSLIINHSTVRLFKQLLADSKAKIQESSQFKKNIRKNIYLTTDESAEQDDEKWLEVVC